MPVTQIQNHYANQPSNCTEQSSSEASDIKWRNVPPSTKPKGWLNRLRESACEPLFLARWIHYTHLQHISLRYVLTLVSPSCLVLPSGLLSSLPNTVICQWYATCRPPTNIQHLFISHTCGYGRIWCGLSDAISMTERTQVQISPRTWYVGACAFIDSSHMNQPG